MGTHNHYNTIIRVTGSHACWDVGYPTIRRGIRTATDRILVNFLAQVLGVRLEREGVRGKGKELGG